MTCGCKHKFKRVNRVYSEKYQPNKLNPKFVPNVKRKPTI